MKENSVEEEIKIVEKFNKENRFRDCGKINNAIDHILSDYKRVLKENEELKDRIREHTMLISPYYVKENYIPVQKVKDIIERIDYDIKKTKEIISNNSNIYTSNRKNDYQIVRLRAMNTKSLDIKNRLQELIEGRK